MKWGYIEENWASFDTKVPGNWEKLTEADTKDIAGSREQLSCKIQERYGVGREEAEKQIAAFSAEVVGKGVTRYEIR